MKKKTDLCSLKPHSFQQVNFQILDNKLQTKDICQKTNFKHHPNLTLITQN